MTITGSSSVVVPANPDSVFAMLTNIEGLPSWNSRMTRVVEQPALLQPGSEWVVEFRVFGRTWHSRSTLDEFDPGGRRFTYRSRTDDGNPSEASWAWTVADDPAGARVTVSWSLRPVTFWRRVLLGPIRARQLAHTEVPASLAALASASKVAGTAG
jgi:uncharacterized protein YndB with AHSA1/START domain